MDVQVTTATLFSRLPLNSELRVGGFAPRHLSRSPLLKWQRGNRILLVLNLKN